MVRILFTGSRAHQKPIEAFDAICYFLSEIAERHPQPLRLVNGYCKTKKVDLSLGFKSVDEMIFENFEDDDVFIPENHPAEWNVYGNAAGMIRNRFMIDLGATYGLALPQGSSPGTRNCCLYARNAGIPMCLIESEDLSDHVEIINNYFKEL